MAGIPSRVERIDYLATRRAPMAIRQEPVATQQIERKPENMQAERGLGVG